MMPYTLAAFLASLSLVVAQIATIGSLTSSRTVTDTLLATETAQITNSAVVAPTSVPIDQACAVVSSLLAEQAGAPYVVRADLVNECQQSAPIVKEDALRLIDGIVAGLEFQSDVGHLANPPQGYLLAGVDLFAEIQQVKDSVNSGLITGEIDFERNMSAVLGKAQDGHLNFLFDGIAPFIYQRQFTLVSVSSDGRALPQIFILDDLIAYLGGSASQPSAVTQVNSEDIASFLTRNGQNLSYGALQDPDALYNQQLYVLNAGTGGSDSIGYFAISRNYQGPETTLTLADGSSRTEVNIAVFNSIYDYTGLSDGASYYNLFCNATYKDEVLYGGSTSSLKKRYDVAKQTEKKLYKIRTTNDLVERQVRFEKRQNSLSEIFTATSAAQSVAPTATRVRGYPSPIALSNDLTLSGYFLEGQGLDDTAVLVLQAMSETDPVSFQATMTTFLNTCRNQKKTRLVLDIQGNPGGSVSLGYDTFKQLFPDIYPYGAGTLRAHEGLDILGTFYTNYTSQVYASEPNNLTLLEGTNYYMQYSAEAYANSSGQLFETWPELYGPVDAGTDNFTNLIRWNLNDTNFNLAVGNLVISGFGNNTDVAPSPFTPENIIVLADGRCSSTCTILTHFLKYQAKVKSIAMGGRPQNGAMQAVGGIKGSQVYQYYRLHYDVQFAHQVAGVLGYTDQVSAIEDSSILGPIYNDSDYVILRGANAGVPPAAFNDFTFNFQNNIAEGDTSYTPLQFVYEAADCRLWYQPQHIYDVNTLWATAAEQAFGLNNVQVFSLCVDGSTNAPSSLSGNATLFNSGNPNNVTDFMPAQSGGGGGGGGGGGSSSSGRVEVEVTAMDRDGWPSRVWRRYVLLLQQCSYYRECLTDGVSWLYACYDDYE